MSSEANHNNLLCSHTDLYPLQYLAPAKTLRLTPAASNFSRPNRNSARCVSKRAYFGARLESNAGARKQPMSPTGFIAPERFKYVRSGFCLCVVSWLYFTPLLPSALATTKGLNQIVTPDVQPEGDFSLSFQWQSKQIANPYQFQAELGLTKFFEVAVFQGIQPEETIFGTELGLIQKDPYLLSVGFLNWSTNGEAPQPFLEGGYYTEHHKLIAGMQAVHNRM